MGRIKKKFHGCTPVISQDMLASIMLHDRRIKEHTDTLVALKRSRESEATLVKAMLTEGAFIQPGRYLVALKKTSRVVVKWKAAFIRNLGKALACAEQECTKPTTTVTVVVSTKREEPVHANA